MAGEEEETGTPAEAPAPADSGAKLAQAMIVMTTVMLLLATIAMLHLLGKHYNEGMFAGG